MTEQRTEGQGQKGDPLPTLERGVIRLNQRKLILDELDPTQRTLVEKLFPSDQILEYKFSTNVTKSSNEVHLDDLLELFNPWEFNERSGGYTLIFKLACTAQTPTELYNIFQGIKTLEQLQTQEYKPELDTQRKVVRSSREWFTGQNRRVSSGNQLSQEAQWVDNKVEDFMQQRGLNASYAMKAVGEEFFSPEEDGYKRYKSALAEFYLYTILNNDWDKYWNDIFLYGTQFFQFGETKTENDRLEMFGPDATFWKQVDGSWVGIDSPLDNFSPMSKDEIAELSKLRAQKASWYYDQQRLSKRLRDVEFALQNVNDSNTQLRQERDILQAQIKEAQRKASGGGGRVQQEHMRGSADAIDSFLGTFNLTKESVGRIADKKKKAELVTRLKRLAALSFHPDNGLAPNERKLQLINGFLNEQEPNSH